MVNLSKIYAHKIARVNKVYFSGITSINFTIKNHCITKGQPFDQQDVSLAVHAEHKIKWHGIYFKAGRHASKDTAECMIHSLAKLPKDKNFSDSFNFPHFSKKLNFAVMGTLTIDGKNFDNLILAQGHAGASNNWWIGGRNCSKDSDEDQIECRSADRLVNWCFIRGGTVSKNNNAPNHINIIKTGCSFIANTDVSNDTDIL